MGHSTRPTQPSIPPVSVVGWRFVHVFTWITEVETIYMAD